ncbi:MAG: Uma2 family endonuclease [Microcoleaceae cyanobacterium]
MAFTTYKWSIEEWHEIVNSGLLEGKPVEFLSGEIISMSPEGVEHSYTNDSVANYLRGVLNNLACVKESHPITLNNSEPEPDVAIVRLPETIYRNHHPYPQDIYWLIEISNRTLKIDLNQKSTIYACNGIPEYWVIDLVNKKLIVHTQVDQDSYARIKEYTAGTVSPLAFPQIAIALDKLLLY